MIEGRYSRNEALFGAEGQERIAAIQVAIVGLGGLGSHLAQQLAYLGVGSFGLVDFDVVTVSNLNRLIGAIEADVTAQAKKIGVAERTITTIQRDADVRALDARVDAPEVRQLIGATDVVFGCVDRDFPRLQLTEICARQGKPYFDLATDTGPQGEDWYGGRVILNDGTRCLLCLDELDQAEIARDAMSPTQRAEDDRIYGMRGGVLGVTGPMVVSVNGVIASMAVIEFMALVTGIRQPFGFLKYRGDKQTVTRSLDAPAEDCYFCEGLWGADKESEG